MTPVFPRASQAVERPPASTAAGTNQKFTEAPIGIQR